MDFINYQPETDAYGYIDSNNETDFESTDIEYRNIEMIVNFDDRTRVLILHLKLKNHICVHKENLVAC